MFRCYRGTNPFWGISQEFRLNSTIDQMLSDISLIAHQGKMQLAYDGDSAYSNHEDSSTPGGPADSTQFPEGFVDAMFEDTTTTSSSSTPRYFFSFGLQSLPSHAELNSFSMEDLEVLK